MYAIFVSKRASVSLEAGPYFDLPVPRVKVLTLVDIVVVVIVVVVVVVVVVVYKRLMTVVSTYQFICLDRRINSFFCSKSVCLSQ